MNDFERNYEAPEDLVEDFVIEVQRIGNHPDALHTLVTNLLDRIAEDCDAVANDTYNEFMQRLHLTIGAVVATIK